MAGPQSFEELKSNVWAKWAQFKRKFWTGRTDELVEHNGIELQAANEVSPDQHYHTAKPLTMTQRVLKQTKIIIFMLALGVALLVWAYKATEVEPSELRMLYTIQNNLQTYVYIDPTKSYDVIGVSLQFPPYTAQYINDTVDSEQMWLRVEFQEYNEKSESWHLVGGVENSNNSIWKINLGDYLDDLDQEVKITKEFDYETESTETTATRSKTTGITYTKTGANGKLSTVSQSVSSIRFALFSNTYEPQVVVFDATQFSSLIKYRVLFAAIVLCFVYVLIIFELLHRTIAAFLGAFAALGVLSLLDSRATIHTVASWVEWETLCLLFGMMIIVAIFGKTGFFEVVGVKAFKLSKGSVWRLTLILSVFTAVVSAFLDNVTTMLLMTPVTIRLCKLIGINPVPMLISEVLMSNIGGTSTAVGDPPVVIIVSNAKLVRRGITFGNLTGYLAPGAIISCVAGLLCIRVIYRHYFRLKIGGAINNAPAVSSSISTDDIHHIDSSASSSFVAHGTALSDDTQHHEDDEESAVKPTATAAATATTEKTATATTTMGASNGGVPSIFELEQAYRIKDMPLFVKCCSVLLVVIVLFFMQSVVDLRLNLAWIALLGALALLLVTGVHDVAEVFEKVEWVTLAFFAALFVLMRALEELELIAFIGETTANLIMMVDGATARLNMALLLLLWVSAFASAFIDNIPYVAAMIPITVTLADKSHIPLQPLIYALGFGACLGGNGTLIGASANVVTSGLAEGQGFPIRFTKFFKAGFPVMIATMVVCTVYMLLLNAVMTWSF